MYDRCLCTCGRVGGGIHHWESEGKPHPGLAIVILKKKKKKKLFMRLFVLCLTLCVLFCSCVFQSF